MPFNGSGRFDLTQDFPSQRDAGLPFSKIQADLVDNVLEDLASGLEACLNRSGENAIAANINWGTFRITNYGSASLGTDVPSARQVANNSLQYGGTTTGASNAYAITQTLYGTVVTGTRILALANHTNDGPATLNLNGAGAIDIRRLNNAELAANDIVSGQLFELIYSDSNFKLLTAGGGDGEGAVDSVNGQTGAVILTKGDFSLGNVDNTSDATKNAAAATLTNKVINGSNNTLTVLAATQISGQLPLANGGTGAVNAAAAFAALKQAATDSVTGVSELATAAEITTGTDAARVITPDGLAGSDFGKTVVSILVFDDSQNVATGDGAGDIFFRVPATLNGYNLVAVAASVETAGATGTTDIQLRKNTSTDMLSTKITIDSAEVDSLTAATAAVINTGADDVSTGDKIRVDVDAVSTTPPKGLLVELTFQLP